MKKSVTAIVVILLSLIGALVTASETDSNVEKNTTPTDTAGSGSNGNDDGSGGRCLKREK